MQARMMQFGSAVQWRKRWRTFAVAGISLLVLVLALRTVQMKALSEAMTPSEPVLCLIAIQGDQGTPIVVYQGQGISLEIAMRSQQLDSLIRDGYTVLDETCFDQWQAAADHLTNGEVWLRDHPTERDFVIAVTRWQQMYGD